MTDVLIVGSGPGGVNAAAPLVAAGRQVVLLDYGNQDRRYAALIPHQPFSEVRRTDAQQHRYFLGDHFEGIPLGPVRVGAQLTPPRLHILADAAERMPVHTDGFAASMSLARGGLGAGWSAGVFPFTDDELRDMGLGLDELRPHYDAVTERIGVCGAGDDLEPFLPPSPSMMPPLELDSNAEVVLTRYQRRRAALNAAAFFLGRTRLAACTERHRERGPYAYLDLDYWADPDRSVYRPQWTLEELQRAPNFTYLDRRFVRTFSEDERGVRVRATRADTGEEETHEAAALVLAGGTLGTARIVLASLGAYDRPVPILCNAYAYVPTLNLGMLRRPARDRRSSLAQLTAVLRVPGTPGRIVQAQLFSYRSLLTFKLMKESPLAYREGLRVLRVLIPKFAILGIHHEDRPAAGKTCVLRRGGPDRRRGRPACSAAAARIASRSRIGRARTRRAASRPTSACCCAASGSSGACRSGRSAPGTARASTTRAPFRSCPRAGRSPATGTAGSAPRAPSTSPTARSSRGSRRRASPST